MHSTVFVCSLFNLETGVLSEESSVHDRPSGVTANYGVELIVFQTTKRILYPSASDKRHIRLYSIKCTLILFYQHIE